MVTTAAKDLTPARCSERVTSAASGWIFAVVMLLGRVKYLRCPGGWTAEPMRIIGADCK